MIEHFDPPAGGMDLESASVRIARGKAEESVNLLPGFPGRAPVRGPLNTSQEYSADGTPPVGVWAHPDGFLVSHENGAGLADLDLAYIPADFGAPTALVAASNFHVPGATYINIGSWVYGLSHPSVDSWSVLYRWDGANNLAGFVQYANAPRAWVLPTVPHLCGLAHWLSRMWVLEGTIDAGTGLSNGGLELHWSDTFDPTAALPDLAATWQDDVSGLINTIRLDVPSGFTTGKALAVVGNALAIFTNEAVYMARGSSPSTLSVRREIGSRGCISAGAVLQYDDGAIFVSSDGVYFYDGSQLVDLSENIKTKFERGTYSGAKITALGRDYVAVTLVSEATNQPTWAGILHVPTRAWTEFKADSDIFNDQYPAFLGGRAGQPVAADDNRLWKLDTVARPKGPVSGTAQVGRDSKDGVFHAITAAATTGLARLSGPGNRSVVRRLFADYVQYTVDTADAAIGWAFSLLDSSGSTLSSVAVADTADSESSRRRHVSDAVAGTETDEVKVRAVFTGSTTADYEGELHDIFLEHAPAQNPASF